MGVHKWPPDRWPPTRKNQKKSTFLNWLFSRVFPVISRFVKYKVSRNFTPLSSLILIFQGGAASIDLRGIWQAPVGLFKKMSLIRVLDTFRKSWVCVEKVPISQVSEKLKKILNRLGAWKIEAVLENQYRKWGVHQNLAKSVFDESGKVEKKWRNRALNFFAFFQHFL